MPDFNNEHIVADYINKTKKSQIIFNAYRRHFNIQKTFNSSTSVIEENSIELEWHS